MNDGYDEQQNPFDGNCKIHGYWKGSYDECPKCMEIEFQRQEADHNAYVSIIAPKCLSCSAFDYDGGSCSVYLSLPLEWFGRKKKCKHYSVYNPHADDFELDFNIREENNPSFDDYEGDI